MPDAHPSRRRSRTRPNLRRKADRARGGSWRDSLLRGCNPAGGVIAELGGYFDAGPIDAHIDLAVPAVDRGLVAGIDQGVLVARVLGDVGVAFLDAVEVALGVGLAAGGSDVLARMLSYMVKGRWRRLRSPRPSGEEPTSVRRRRYCWSEDTR